MNEKVGLFISELRKRKDLTQKDLADKLNITTQAVSKWERGICMPDISLLKDLSDILEVSISELLNGKEERGKKFVDNKEIINALKYADKNIKSKIIRLLDILLIFIVSFIVLLLLFFSVKTTIKFNTKYNSYYTDNGYIIEEVKNRIYIIKNNRGKYSKDEYNTLVNYVNSMDYSLDYEKDKTTFIKESYTYKDILNYVDSEKNIIFGIDQNDIYKILIKKDFEKIDNSYNFNAYMNTYYDNENKLSDFIKNSYSYKTEVDKQAGRYMFDSYKNKYIAYKLILNDIIEVGGLK